MTEAEWLACGDPTPMLEFLRGKASDRKLQLFACGCARSIWQLLRIMDRETIQAAETYADGVEGVPRRMSPRARHSGDPLSSVRLPELLSPRDLNANVIRAATVCAEVHVRRSLVSGGITLGLEKQTKEVAFQADMIRCVFGNPFRPASFDPAWRTSTAVALARQMYESREFTVMPILADALQDAGCTNDDILGHCREASATHVRGCWVADLVLGKE